MTKLMYVLMHTSQSNGELFAWEISRYHTFEAAQEALEKAAFYSVDPTIDRYAIEVQEAKDDE